MLPANGRQESLRILCGRWLGCWAEPAFIMSVMQTWEKQVSPSSVWRPDSSPPYWAEAAVRSVILGLHIFYSTFLYYMMLEIYVWCDHARLSDIVLIGVLVFCSIYGNRISSIFAFIWHCIEIRSAEINEYMKNAAKHAVTSWVLVNLFVLVYPCPLYDIQRICALFDVGDLLADQTN